MSAVGSLFRRLPPRPLRGPARVTFAGMRPSFPHLLFAASALLSIAASPVRAQVTAPTVTVTGATPGETDAAKATSVTRIDRTRIERWQPSTVFEAVQGTPGVALNGGPRASGMSFNIRGYGDSEDVLIKLDGAQKNFEKYRFGGTFIEPELLKGIAITRGPDLLSGAGALGGTVSATTRDAADFLRPGQRFGARLKYGTATGNDQIERSAIGFARPRDDVDLVVAATRRTAGDYRIAYGTTLPDSNLNQRSLLGKGTWFVTERLSLGWSSATVDNRSREAYDATGGVPGIFGSVVRDTEDATHTFNTRYEGAGGLVDFAGTAGQSTTQVKDLHRPGQSLFANNITGNLNDSFDYDVTTLDLKNTARFRTGAVSNELVTSIQGVRNAREVRRVADNAAINASLYPGGFNPAQPSGTRESMGLVAVHTFGRGPWTFSPGVRWDHYRVTADGRARENMIRFGQAWEITEVEKSGSLAGTWRLPVSVPLLLGYRYVQAFKPPLIDEYFTQGAFSRCTVPNLGPLTPASGICGSLYRPERADTQEWSLTLPALALSGGIKVDSRLAYFRNERRHLLLSLKRVGNEVGQPGWEHREGFEFEANATGRVLFASLAYTAIHGRVYDGIFHTDLFDAPGDTAAVTLGARFLGGIFDAGLRYRDVGARSVAVGLTTGNRPVVGRQEGYELVDLFLGYRPSADVELRVALENATNEAYFLNNGFGGSIGAPAPGRSLRFAAALQF